jgi:hypothetical protein
MTLARAAFAPLLLASLIACEGDPVGPSGGPLVPGESRNIAGSRASEKFFTITVPPGTGTLQIRLREGSGDADLIVRFGARPEPGLYDCVSESDGNEEECLFDVPEPGTYYILVYGYSSYADVRLLGSVLPQFGASLLSSGIHVENLSGGAGSFRMFEITVPSGASTLTVTLEATGDADLYVRRAAFPLINFYDCASYTETGSESCIVNAPSSGTWYIRVEGFDPYSAGTLTATVSPPPP